MPKRSLLFLGLYLVLHPIHAQSILEQTITLDQATYTIESLLAEISKKGNVVFSYGNNIPYTKVIAVRKSTQTIKAHLDDVFSSAGIEYLVQKNRILLRAQEKVPSGIHGSITISGHIRDAVSGETLIGASVLLDELHAGTFSNAYGFYSLSVPAGTYTLKISFVGYSGLEQQISLEQNQKLDFTLTPVSQQLSEVTVTATESDMNVTSTEMGSHNINMATVREMPSLAGEVDVLRAVQLLPGVKTASEASSSLFVRGGNLDQNLVLLDEAPVYNPSHLFGIFSVFNADAIKDIQFYKSGFPSFYGGRLSSVLDVRLKDGNTRSLGVSGGVGTVSSRLTVEGPLAKDRSSFIVSGRYTYSDLITRTVKYLRENDMRLYFYDLSAKVNHTFNDKNKIFLSGYLGADANAFGATNIQWSNATATARWNHVFHEKLFSNFTLLYSKYDSDIGAMSILQKISDYARWKSSIRDITFKGDLTWYAGQHDVIRYGLQSTHHQINSGTAAGKLLADGPVKVPVSNALEHAVYVSHEHQLSDRIALEYGLRYSLFQNIGKGTSYTYDDNHVVTDTLNVKSGEIFHTSGGLEPRVSARFMLNRASSLKIAYNRTRQYLQLLSNSSVGLNAFDIWLPSGPNVKPQSADQISFGYFRNLQENKYETSAEVYYKWMHHQIDFTDHARLLFNSQLESELRTGKGWSYGAEFFLKKNSGMLTGWLSYTYAIARKDIPAISNKPYPTHFDQPHNVTLVTHQKISRSWSLSANWTYATGRPITLAVESFNYGDMTVPVYAEKNHFRMRDYHRLDLAATYSKTRPDRKYSGSWTFSLYNAYFRKNDTAIVMLPRHGWDPNPQQADDNKVVAQRITLFPFFPSITYNFKF
ncbi:carboxypeptidase-like regulatory domain-containing protein [Fulvivirgaceae bacterium PWU4]|uniref:Carboxypeptidase-like regulatory domain-containing protein n=1 Tax=Chryseosolibacter histidini TaxID=2782349 RepID=A0AAP2DGL0_9BACT|nr:TonB-dependent receptor [Chryseosolibacter histidini]MBT1695850.1 carboxypeptidase-like regulatory domain-containing protein [Chryseosolibacter histidini]